MPTKTKLFEITMKARELYRFRPREFVMTTHKRATNFSVAAGRALHDFKVDTIPARARIGKIEVTIHDLGTKYRSEIEREES